MVIFRIIDIRLIMQITTLLILALATFAENCFAEVRQDGIWYFPTSVKTICMDTEQSMVAVYKNLIETNRKMTDTTDKNTDKTNLLQIAESSKKYLIENEEKWMRLGCSSILYPNNNLKK